MSNVNSYGIKGFSFVAIASGFLGIVALIYFIILSGVRELTQLEVMLFSILIFLLETYFALYTGMWTEKEKARKEYQPFVRSALRRTYGLKEGLVRVNDNIHESLSRMSNRGHVSQIVYVQWEERMNLISYQLIELQRQAEASIEDWREVGREEIERLEKSEMVKEEQITEITEQLGELRELIDNLSTTPTGAESVVERLENLAKSFERELERLHSQSVTVMQSTRKGEARKMMLKGAYEDSIEAYSKMIISQPKTHTIYISRAVARYLSGDKDGALADLDIAEKLQPKDPYIKIARQKIIEGNRFFNKLPLKGNGTIKGNE